jgi:cytochrome b561
MADRVPCGTPAKIFHWLIVALMLIQLPIGWFMPNIHGGMKPGSAMTATHIVRTAHAA